MASPLKLPVGIEYFEKIRRDGFYYVDKTGLIKELLDNSGEVNLFTRPRRFGKTLNMNMLQYFFEYGSERELFDGLKIAEEKELCEKYMGNFPVVFVSLKDVSARDFLLAKKMLCSIIREEALRFQFLLESSRITDAEKDSYRQLIHIDVSGQQGSVMPDETVINSLRTLCSLLHKHYGQKVILLIDEYDAPLDKARQEGFYDEMISLIRNLFSRALKTNPSLHFAVLTGCLRIARESIFTGLNNLKCRSIIDSPFGEQFGFTGEEVRRMLAFYGLEDRFEFMKDWYDGYLFGDTDIYCPWDVINYVDLLRSEPKALPRAYWINTSGNDIIRSFIRTASPQTKRELECLIDGGTVKKKINQELTYRDLYQNTENLWSVLFATGYLTRRKDADTEAAADYDADDIYSLAIPNREIRKIFIDQVMEWFKEETRKDSPKLDAFCDAFVKADAAAVEEYFTAYLQKTISIRDTSVQKGRKENFYHGVLLGLLSHREDWIITSNAESGDGFSDILIELEEEGIGIIIEVKYPDEEDLENGCKKALAQIERMHYEEKLLQDGYCMIYKYGIACRKKRCMVRLSVSET